LFLILIDRLGKSLRPVSVIARVAELGHRVIDDVYPEPFAAVESKTSPAPALGRPARIVTQAKAGYLLAFDEPGLLEIAQRLKGVIELVPQVGDFVGPNDPLFRLYGEVRSFDERELRERVALGPERTMQQDPGFAFRILVDLASKALSPAINDPTTAVLAVDQIHALLHAVGTRRLDTGRGKDSSELGRFLYRTPDWDDFVFLAVVEIRQFGQSSIQIPRRLRAMLEDLLQTLPEPRCARLREEIETLRRGVAKTFSEPEDLLRADVPDYQGVGGHWTPHDLTLGTTNPPQG
jgi:uncharacterized membrane protein